MLFILLLGGLSVLNIARQKAGPEILDRESRRITPWPGLSTAGFFNGTWARGMEDAFADRFLLRDKGLAAAAWIDSLKGLSARSVRLVDGNNAYLHAGNPENANYPIEGSPESTAEPSSSLNLPASGEGSAEKSGTATAFAQTSSASPQATAGFVPTPSPVDALPLTFDNAQQIAEAAAFIEKVPSSLIPAASSSAASQAKKTEVWTSKVLICENRGYETAWYTDYAADYYAKAIANLADSIGREATEVDNAEAGPCMYVMVIPSAIEFLRNEKYRNLSYPQNKGIQDIYAKLPESVTAINVIPELAAHGDEYIFYKTDHHWTGLGAWYAYKATAETLGVVPYPYSAYPKESIPDFLGTMYNRTRAAELLQNPDTVELVYPFMEHTFAMLSGKDPVYGKAVDKAYIQGFNTYLANINGDYPHSEIASSVKNGLKILILKDSYANAFIPYLIPHFEEIHIIDPRYWIGSVPSYVKEHGITDVLIFNYYLVVSVYVGFASNLFRVTGQR